MLLLGVCESGVSMEAAGMGRAVLLSPKGLRSGPREFWALLLWPLQDLGQECLHTHPTHPGELSGPPQVNK